MQGMETTEGELGICVLHFSKNREREIEREEPIEKELEEMS